MRNTDKNYLSFMNLATIQQHPASVDAYIRHGWSLVPIPSGTKGPRTVGWNLRHNAIKSQNELQHGYGIGLAHAYSGTMALDIDHWDKACSVLSTHSIEIQALYDANDAVIVDSGKAGHGKLLYQMPFGLTLPSKKVTIDGVTVYELRCATSSGLTVQDVLPPSIHPDTNQPYRWAGRGHWTRLPMLPDALYKLWDSLLTQDSTPISTPIDYVAGIPTDWEEIQSALNSIPADCSRSEWISVGMALHWAGAQCDQITEALQMWNDWSQEGEKYPGQPAIVQQWQSFKDKPNAQIRIGTLLHIAKQHGWRRPIPDVSELFSSIEKKSPHDMMENMRPKRPDMRMELWPSVLSTRAEEISESVGCDPLVPLYAGLAAICGVIDARTRLELMPGFKVPPVLWLMTVGDPADKKSPGSRPMLSPLRDIEAEDRPRYSKDLLDWEGKEAAYSVAKKSFLEWASSTDALMGADQAPTVPDLPTPPTPLKITVSDITSQKLVRAASDRPRGLLCHLDEMNSWVRKLTDKASGEDRSAWVVSYESEHYEMDRVGAGSIHCDNLAVSIYGNIQPQVLKANFGALSADGLLQRFIPALLRADKTKLGQPIPDHLTSSESWSTTLRLIYALPPQTYRLSSEAYDVYRTFQKWFEDAKRDERLLNAGVEYMTAFGKLEGLAGRLCLVWHAIEAPFSPTVSADLMSRVIDLIRGYIIPAYRWMYGELIEEDTFTSWVIDHIVQHSDHVHQVDYKTIKRSARRHFSKLQHTSEHQKMQMVLDAMSVLESSGWVIKIEEELHKQRITWAVNPNLPTLFKEYRETVIKAKQRHVDYIYRIAYDYGKSRKYVKGYDPETMD